MSAISRLCRSTSKTSGKDLKINACGTFDMVKSKVLVNVSHCSPVRNSSEVVFFGCALFGDEDRRSSVAIFFLVILILFFPESDSAVTFLTYQKTFPQT
jgi:high-affinity Fe2+/Pb2+ permease